MILIWKGEKLGEISTPTFKEMRVIKRDLGIRNPLAFLAQATALMEPVEQRGPDGKLLLDLDGKPVVKVQPGENFDFECLAMLVAILMTRLGRPTEMEDVDGDLATDLRLEMTADEKARAVEQLGKAGAAGETVARALDAIATSPATTSPTPTA